MKHQHFYRNYSGTKPKMFTICEGIWKGVGINSLALVLFFILLGLFFVNPSISAGEVPPPPGTVIDCSPDPSGIFIGSPSIEFLPNGTYIASHDWFGSKSSKEMITVFFQSNDRGQTWTKISELKNHYWSKLFYCNGALWSIGWAPKTPGIKTECIAIRKSTDGGRTWTEPKDAKSGLLLSDRSYSCEPNPILFHNGRIWTAFEAMGPMTGKDKRKWATGFCPFIASAPIGANLLDRSVWTFSNSIPWTHQPGLAGWLEGNVLVDPNGKMLALLRVDDVKNGGKAARINISDDGKTASFDPKTGFIAMPGGCKKFMIRYDQKTNKYWALANWIHPADVDHPDKERVRNTLALVASDDLTNWEVRTILLRHVDTTKGFQYVDWRFEGQKDLVFVSRTAWEGAPNCHDANFLTFHRVRDYRYLTRDNDQQECPIFKKPYTIDTDFPGGHAFFEKIGENEVEFCAEPTEPRFTELWRTNNVRNVCVNFDGAYHWAFRVRNAQGRTIRFSSTRGKVVGFAGAAVSNDNGVTWKQTNAKPDWQASRTQSFSYTFGPGENNVLFAVTALYTQSCLDRFLAQFDTKHLVKRATLCTSAHGRIVERLELGNPSAPYAFLLTARHHPPETEASFALQGFLEEVLADSKEGDFLRKNFHFFVVPFVAKDDVEEGGDHCRTRPHNYNRDYVERLFPEIRAITEQVPQWSKGKKLISLDLHTPGPSGWYTYFITKESKKEHFEPFREFYQQVEKFQDEPGQIPVACKRMIFDYLPNERGRICAWSHEQPNSLLATCIEIPLGFSATDATKEGGIVDWYIYPDQLRTESRPVNPDTLRTLGRNIARSFAIFFANR